VTLFEAADRIGGQFNLARRIPGKEEFAQSLRYWNARLEPLGVALRVGHEATLDDREPVTQIDVGRPLLRELVPQIVLGDEAQPVAAQVREAQIAGGVLVRGRVLVLVAHLPMLFRWSDPGNSWKRGRVVGRGRGRGYGRCARGAFDGMCAPADGARTPIGEARTPVDG